MNKSLLGLTPKPLLWTRAQNHYAEYWIRVAGDLRVIESLETHNGERWLHVSASHTLTIPTWEEMREVKETFIGKDREAYMVMPPEERYINDNPTVLHLWCCVDGPVLPDFRRFGPRLGKAPGLSL